MKGEVRTIDFSSHAQTKARVYQGVLGYHKTLSRHITEFEAPYYTVVHVPSKAALFLTHNWITAKQSIAKMLKWPIDWPTIHLAEDGQADKLRLEQELTDLIDGQRFLSPKEYGFGKKMKTDLRKANLTSNNLSYADLAGANLTGADLIDANLTGANLSGADLTHTDLSRANLSGANLTGAKLIDALLIGAKYDDDTMWPAHFDIDASGAIRIGTDGVD